MLRIFRLISSLILYELSSNHLSLLLNFHLKKNEDLHLMNWTTKVKVNKVLTQIFLGCPYVKFKPVRDWNPNLYIPLKLQFQILQQFWNHQNFSLNIPSYHNFRLTPFLKEIVTLFQELSPNMHKLFSQERFQFPNFHCKFLKFLSHLKVCDSSCPIRSSFV